MDGKFRQQWPEEETQCFLALWSSTEVQNKLEGASRTKPVFEEIQREMAAAGYERSLDQLLNKLKKLKKDYRDQRRQLGRSGSGRLKKNPHFDLLHSVLGDRPDRAANQTTVTLDSATAMLESMLDGSVDQAPATDSVSDVERRSRSLRTQYGRVSWHPEKLDFLRPYTARRRCGSCVEDDDDEELETEESIDQDMGSSLGSPLDADVTGQDPDDDEPQSVASSTPNFAPLHCPDPQPQVTEVMSLSWPERHNDQSDQPDQLDQRAAPNTSEHDILSQFAEVMLADMRQIKDPLVLMRLRRDITDLVFKAVQEDVQRRSMQAPSLSMKGGSTQSCSSSQRPRPQMNIRWRQRFLKRRSKECETGRRLKHMKSQLSLPVQQGEAVDAVSGNSSQVTVQKRETGLHVVKIEEETVPQA